MITIRDAVEADLEGVARVHEVQGWRKSYTDFLFEGAPLEERALKFQGPFVNPNPQTKFLVAEAANGEIVGFVHSGPGKRIDLLDTEAKIFAIYMLDKVKRQGIGRRLMQGVFSHLAARGLKSAGLWVLKDDTGTRRFCEALGGVAGPEQSHEFRVGRVTEIAYRFAPIPVL